MKDIAVRGIITIASFGFALLCGSYLMNGTQVSIIIPSLVSLIGLIIVFCSLGVVLGVYPIALRGLKRIITVLGVAMILFGNYVLLDDPNIGLYLGDVASVFGVVIAILGPSGILIPEKIKRQHREEKIQIIEV